MEYSDNLFVNMHNFTLFNSDVKWQPDNL